MESSPLVPRPDAPFQGVLSRFRAVSWSSPTSKKFFLCRAIAILAILSVGVINAATGDFLPTKDVACIWDGFFEMTSSLNSYLQDHSPARDSILIFSSLLIDILMLTIAVRFVFFGKSCRTLLFLIGFYGIRAAIMSVFILRFPDGHIFTYPGFPSLMVTYAHTSDFFFSGHVGFATFAVLENFSYENYFLMGLAIFTVVVESTVMIVTRGHYTVDIIAGIVFAHYIWIITGWISPFLDRRLAPPVKDKEAQL